MGRFEFRSNGIELDFAGVKTIVPGTMEYAKKLEEAGHKMVIWGSDPANAKAGAEAARDFMLGILDDLLGEEAMDAIEDVRELDIYDCTDMFAYIKDEVAAYHNGRTEKYLKEKTEPTTGSVPVQPMAQTAAENRAARRAKRRRK